MQRCDAGVDEDGRLHVERGNLPRTYTAVSLSCAAARATSLSASVIGAETETLRSTSWLCQTCTRASWEGARWIN